MDGLATISPLLMATRVMAAQTEQSMLLTSATQNQAEQTKQQAQRRQIIEETKTKLFQIEQETMINRAKAGDKIHEKWVDVISG